MESYVITGIGIFNGLGSTAESVGKVYYRENQQSNHLRGLKMILQSSLTHIQV